MRPCREGWKLDLACCLLLTDELFPVDECRQSTATRELRYSVTEEQQGAAG